MAKTLIKTVTVGAGGAMSLDISNIPSTFTDLEITLSARGGAQNVSTATDILQMRFNGSTTGYSYRSLWQLTGTIYTTTNSSNALPTSGGDTTAGTFGSSTIYIPNYAGSNNKAWSVDSAAEQNSTTGVWLNITSGLWANTSAITSISFVSLNDFALQPGTTASLYGVKKDNILPVPKATGGTIKYAGGYWYHTFTSSGDFVASTSLTADLLVVSGGGSSGNSVGVNVAGGGAGGAKGWTGVSVTSGTKTVVVGGGGVNPGSGNASSFDTTYATTGGGMGAGNYNAAVGGSGGGGSSGGSSTRNGAAGTAGEGFAGGNGSDGSSAGGGGAGAAGTNGYYTTSYIGGSGGNGTSAFSAWGLATGTGQNVSGTVYYAGGGGGSGNGGGGAGGYGGGGEGRVNTATAASGTGGTGGGGGGYNSGIGTLKTAAGGSGIVIVRYLG